MILRRALLLLLQISVALASTQNADQAEGSGNLQNLVNGGEPGGDQETGSGMAQISAIIDPSTSGYDTYLDSEFEPSIVEALLSSDSWMVDNTDNDIIFDEEEPTVGGDVTTGNNVDDEDYVAEMSGNNPLEEVEEETNALGGQLTLGDGDASTRTLNSPSKPGVFDIGNDIEVISVHSIGSPPSDHIDGNALGKTGDKGTSWLPVLDNFSGWSAILLLSGAVVVGVLLSVVGFVLFRYRPCRGSTHRPATKMDHYYLE